VDWRGDLVVLQGSCRLPCFTAAPGTVKSFTKNSPGSRHKSNGRIAVCRCALPLIMNELRPTCRLAQSNVAGRSMLGVVPSIQLIQKPSIGGRDAPERQISRALFQQSAESLVLPAINA